MPKALVHFVFYSAIKIQTQSLYCSKPAIVMSHKHAHHDIFINRKEFQLERLILFSDAVFAIAITLLVIEIKVPTLKEISAHGVAEALWEKFPEFFGFLLSFAVIGQFWTNHHRIFGYVTNYTTGLLWLNLNMLFWVVLVPFTSGFNSHHGNLDAVWMLYCFNVFMISLSIYFINRYIGNEKRNLSTIADKPLIKKFMYQRSLAVTSIFLLGLLLCIPNWTWASWASRFIFFLIPIVIIRINKKAAKVKQLHSQ
jgi:uncharacterized membrane protein